MRWILGWNRRGDPCGAPRRTNGLRLVLVFQRSKNASDFRTKYTVHFLFVTEPMQIYAIFVTEPMQILRFFVTDAMQIEKTRTDYGAALPSNKIKRSD